MCGHEMMVQLCTTWPALRIKIPVHCWFDTCIHYVSYSFHSCRPLTNLQYICTYVRMWILLIVSCSYLINSLLLCCHHTLFSTLHHMCKALFPVVLIVVTVAWCITVSEYSAKWYHLAQHRMHTGLWCHSVCVLYAYDGNSIFWTLQGHCQTKSTHWGVLYIDCLVHIMCTLCSRGNVVKFTVFSYCMSALTKLSCLLVWKIMSMWEIISVITAVEESNGRDSSMVQRRIVIVSSWKTQSGPYFP